MLTHCIITIIYQNVQNFKVLKKNDVKIWFFKIFWFNIWCQNWKLIPSCNLDMTNCQIQYLELSNRTDHKVLLDSTKSVFYTSVRKPLFGNLLVKIFGLRVIIIQIQIHEYCRVFQSARFCRIWNQTPSKPRENPLKIFSKNVICKTS